jgi:D-amino-acid dehydrogenase
MRHDRRMSAHPAPRTVAVVGAGMVGLSTAWFLQEHGVEVVVVDRRAVAAGASWGNAGWVTPMTATPLPDPAVLRTGIRGLLDRRSAIYLPRSTIAKEWRFLLRFIGSCTHPAWQRSMAALRPLHVAAGETFEQLAGTADDLVVTSRDVHCGFERAEQADGLLAELRAVAGTGLPVEMDLLTGAQVRAAEPAMSERVSVGLRLGGQRYIDPPRFCAALAEQVSARGGKLLLGSAVDSVTEDGGRPALAFEDGHRERFDAVVLATGAWLPRLGRAHGVRTQLVAGRGYSFSVRTERMPGGPTYFPAAKAACTPLADRLRITGTMEFGDVEAPLDMRRINTVERNVRPLLAGVDWSSRSDEWVGGRPVTADGRPLLGASATPGVYIAGGHGMWGITFGPLSGKLVAGQVVSGVRPDVLAPFDPLRR